MYKMLQHELDPHFAEAIAKTAVRFDVFVVCDGREHCRRVQALVNDLVPSNVRTGIYDSAESTVLADPSYNVVFVPKNFDRGYNGGGHRSTQGNGTIPSMKPFKTSYQANN